MSINMTFASLRLYYLSDSVSVIDRVGVVTRDRVAGVDYRSCIAARVGTKGRKYQRYE